MGLPQRLLVRSVTLRCDQDKIHNMLAMPDVLAALPMLCIHVQTVIPWTLHISQQQIIVARAKSACNNTHTAKANTPEHAGQLYMIVFDHKLYLTLIVEPLGNLQ